MLIFEVDQSNNGNIEKLVAIVTLLSDRAEDETARKEISQDAFIKLANDSGVMITPASLGEMIAKPPLKNILEPLEPNSGVVRFKGNSDATTDMSVDQAQDIVDRNAKAAMRRAMK